MQAKFLNEVIEHKMVIHQKRNFLITFYYIFSSINFNNSLADQKSTFYLSVSYETKLINLTLIPQDS